MLDRTNFEHFFLKMDQPTVSPFLAPATTGGRQAPAARGQPAREAAMAGEPPPFCDDALGLSCTAAQKHAGLPRIHGCDDAGWGGAGDWDAASHDGGGGQDVGVRGLQWRRRQVRGGEAHGTPVAVAAGREWLWEGDGPGLLLWDVVRLLVGYIFITNYLPEDIYRIPQWSDTYTVLGRHRA